MDFQISITGRNFEVGDDIKEYLIKRIEKLGKYSSRIVKGRVIIGQSRGRYRVEIILFADHLRYYGDGKGEKIRSSIDNAVCKVDKQMRRHKERVQRKHKHKMQREVEAEVEEAIFDEEEG